MWSLFPALVAAVFSAPQAAVIEAERAAVAASNNRDATRLAACYADDVVLALGHGPALVGKPAVLDWIAALVRNREVAFRYQSLKAEVSRRADLGFTFSRYEVSITRPDGSHFVETGHWTQVWRNGPAGWRIALETATPDR